MEYDFYELKNELVLRLCEDKVEYEVIHNRYDKGYKSLLSVKKNFIEFVKTFVKIEEASDLREEDITLLDKEFITIDFEKSESDLVYEVKHNGKEIYFVLLEIQSKVDRKMGYRLLNYMLEIWRKWDRNRVKSKTFSLPKIIPCVLYNGDKDWDSPIEFKDLYMDSKDEDYLVNFKYILVDINKYGSEELLNMGNILSACFYLDTGNKRDLNERLEKLVDSLRGMGKEEIGEFKRWIVNVLAVKDDDKKVLEEKITSKEDEEMGNFMKVLHEYYDDGVRDGMEQGMERGRIEGMEQGIECGMKRGRIEGMEQGIERGMKRGRIEGMEQGIKREKVEFIKRLLKNKLKIKLSKDIVSKIDNASNKELNEIEKRIFEINSIEEVIDIFA